MTVGVSIVTRPKPVEQLSGLVWGVKRTDASDDFAAGDDAWYRSPWLLGAGALALVAALNVVFI